MGSLINGNRALMGNKTHAYGGYGSVADANSPLPGILDSIDQFDNLGIPRNQVVVALPWCVCSCRCCAFTDRILEELLVFT